MKVGHPCGRNKKILPQAPVSNAGNVPNDESFEIDSCRNAKQTFVAIDRAPTQEPGRERTIFSRSESGDGTLILLGDLRTHLMALPHEPLGETEQREARSRAQSHAFNLQLSLPAKTRLKRNE